MQCKNEANQETTINERNLKNREAICNEIKKLDVISFDTVADLLPRLLAEGKLQLDLAAYPPADSTTIECKGIGRYLLYDHADKENVFSIWVFSFAPQQKTCIHDHKYKASVTVLEGPVSEKYFQPSGELKAQLVRRVDRYRFHTNRDVLEDNVVHQIKRRKALGQGVSVTMHIYNMEAYFTNPDNIQTDRRNLKIIYSKDKSANNRFDLPYEKEEYKGCRLG